MNYEKQENIPIANIEPNKFNPNVMSLADFESLKEGMKLTGAEHDLAVDPIIVSLKEDFYGSSEAKRTFYVIIDGEHRWKAAKDLGWQWIPCQIRKVTEETAKILNFRRNRERGTLDPLKEATLFKSELDGGFTQEEVAQKYNVSRPYVANRLGLVQLDEKVVKMFREPDEAFTEIKTEEYEEEVKKYEEAQEHEGYQWMREPEEPTDEELVPRGTLSTSHLEPISTLPAEIQPEIAKGVLERGWTVRDTERQVKQTKEEIAKVKRFQAALQRAKRPKCPSCGGDPEDFSYSNENKFKCGATGCYNSWEYMKTRAEVEAEKEAERTEEQREANKELTERLKEARENPRFIRMKETPEELHEKVRPWILRKIHELTEIDRVQLHGKRGDEVIQIDYTPPIDWSRMDLTLRIGDQRFGFNVQAKQYKKIDAKSRVDLDYPIKPTEENRTAMRRFFTEVVETDEDPAMVNR